jgi:hypothetical protein
MYGPAGQETKSFTSESSKVSGDRKQMSIEMAKKDFLCKDVNRGNGFQNSHPRHATSSRMADYCPLMLNCVAIPFARNIIDELLSFSEARTYNEGF